MKLEVEVLEGVRMGGGARRGEVAVEDVVGARPRPTLPPEAALFAWTSFAGDEGFSGAKVIGCEGRRTGADDTLRDVHALYLSPCVRAFGFVVWDYLRSGHSNVVLRSFRKGVHLL